MHFWWPVYLIGLLLRHAKFALGDGSTVCPPRDVPSFTESDFCRSPLELILDRKGEYYTYNLSVCLNFNFDLLRNHTTSAKPGFQRSWKFSVNWPFMPAAPGLWRVTYSLKSHRTYFDAPMNSELLEVINSEAEKYKMSDPFLLRTAKRTNTLMDTKHKMYCGNLFENYNCGFQLILEYSLDSSTQCSLRGPIHFIRLPSEAVTSIVKQDMSDMVVKAGSDIRFDVRITGDPFPQVVWFDSKGVLRNDSRTTIETRGSYTHKKTILTIHGATRNDSGNYTLMVRHDNSVINVDTNVTSQASVLVTSVPTRPEGPLEIPDVTANNAKLKFKKPLDDGGQDMSHYEFEKQEAGTGNWVPCGRTKDANETEGKVEGLTPGKKYLFRVKAVNADGDGEPLELDVPVLTNTLIELNQRENRSQVDHISPIPSAIPMSLASCAPVGTYGRLVLLELIAHMVFHFPFRIRYTSFGFRLIISDY